MRRIVLAAVAVLFAQQAAHAAVSCPDMTPAAISSVSAAGRKCQETVAREGWKFLKAKMTHLSNCKLKNGPGVCPTSKEVEKIEKAALKAQDKIADACGDDAAQGGLVTSYGDLTDPAVISSCVLSQHSVAAEWVVENAIGVTGEDWLAPFKERSQCMKEMALRARLFVQKATQNATVCIKKQMKDGVAGNLAPICVGSWSGGTFVAPTDTKTAEKQSKLVALVEQKLQDKCGFVETSNSIDTLFGCAGAETVADLQQCILCGGWSQVHNVLEQEYAEDGIYVAPGAGALQAAVTAASDGDKLLVGSGTYDEEVLVTQNDFSIVGCGAATDDRPLIIPPATEVTGRGIRGDSLTNFTVQSIRVEGQDNDGIRITNSNGVVFRDITGDGKDASAYAVFPQTCNNVLVELCKLRSTTLPPAPPADPYPPSTRSYNDAPIYVGQSSTVTVRWNDVRDSVAAIEIENCGNSHVHNNYATRSTAGILVFKDGSLPVQLSQCHHVHHNVFENNNFPNFGSGTVAGIPDGTGMLIISNDTTPIHHNISRGHITFGFAFTDQAASGFGPPFSADQNPTENYVFDNVFLGNGTVPNPELPVPGLEADATVLLFSPSVGNCQKDNVLGTSVSFLDLPTCTLPPPDPFATCPAPSVP